MRGTYQYGFLMHADGVRPDILTFVTGKGGYSIPMFGIPPLPSDECQNVRPDPATISKGII